MEQSNYIRKEGCPHCGSSDANAIYTDHAYCFSCETYSMLEDREPQQPANTNLIDGEVNALTKRGISLETAKFWDYRIGNYKGQPVQIANYKNNKGQTIGQKLRFANKDFLYLGDSKDIGLYGQHLWRNTGKMKMVTITEGEVEALSISQCFNNRWPVVSLPQGCASAKKAISKSIEWLEQFDSVVLAFDSDPQGVKAAHEAALLLSPGKAKIVSFPSGYKDANDMLKANQQKALLDAIWGAKSFRPDGILAGVDLWDMVTSKDDKESVSYPYQGITDKTMGLRVGEIVTISAGSGTGKSQFTKEIAHHLIRQGETLGYIALEENVKRTAQSLMSLSINKPIHLGSEGVTDDELKHAFADTLGTGRVFLYDHWGSTDSDNLLNKVRYLARGCGCNWIVLDHLSIVVSGMEGGDERRTIDTLMTQLRTLVEELQIGLILVSHLKRPSGDRGHEDGAQTSMSQLRGSAAIGQLSDMVIGLERNQQDQENLHTTTVRLLKNRWCGITGICCHLAYSIDTNRMTETVMDYDEETTPDF